MPEWGFIDSVSDFTGVHVSHTSASMTALFNPYAAVPSMHVAFALMIGWPLARLARHRIVSVLWLLYPLLMAFVIVATANHFIFDAILGALTAGASAYGAMLARAGAPAVWRVRSRSGSDRAKYMTEPDGDLPPSSTATMAPRRHETAPRGPRRAACRDRPGAPAPRSARANGASSCATP